jgi:hypothetical protein
MDIQQAINLGMMDEFARIGVRFAMPSRAVHVASLPEMPEQLTRGNNANSGQMAPSLRAQH